MFWNDEILLIMVTARFQLSEKMPLEFMSADPSTVSSDSADSLYRCAKCRLVMNSSNTVCKCAKYDANLLWYFARNVPRYVADTAVNQAWSIAVLK